MTALRIISRPTLRRPILVTSFLGWNDASESATGAVRYLRRRVRTEPIAEIDPDDFFVFSEQRPTVRLTKGQVRQIKWPSMDFTPMRRDESEHDFILALGTEPHLTWKAFAADLVAYARAMQVEEIVTLGALLADTPHTRPVPLTGGASDPARAAELGFSGSRYEGPTGIVGVISDLCRQEAMPHISVWASVPHYVSGGQNPRATRALLQRLAEIYHLDLELQDLDARSRRYEVQVSEALEQNPEMREYVARLEADSSADDEPSRHQHDDDAPSTPLRSTEVLDEVDRLLRGEDPSPGSGDAPSN